MATMSEHDSGETRAVWDAWRAGEAVCPVCGTPVNDWSARALVCGTCRYEPAEPARVTTLSAEEFYDRAGTRVDYATWRRLRDDPGYRFVVRDRVGDLEVVTAWLGRDQGPFADTEVPQIFGTVTRAADGALLDEEELFAGTETEARANHAAVLGRRRSDGRP